jgi:EAL domain-containing protein (putative c-di-GMP-specific phosphodiesterase class I)
MRAACLHASSWSDPLRMHVNLSVGELLAPDLVTHVADALAQSGLEASKLVLEITESQLLGDAEAAARRFEELRALGVAIALDDFGTGYSSLSFVHSLPLDILKIAKEFVDGLEPGGRDAGFVGMIVDLARTLNLQVIAEAIETPEQLAALREVGTELGQGYLLGRPGAPTVTPSVPAA